MDMIKFLLRRSQISKNTYISPTLLDIESSKKYISAELILLACWDKMIIWQNNWVAVHHCKFFWTPCHVLLWAISELLMASSPCLCLKCLIGTWVTCWLTERTCWVAQVTFWLAQWPGWLTFTPGWLKWALGWQLRWPISHCLSDLTFPRPLG